MHNVSRQPIAPRLSEREIAEACQREAWAEIAANLLRLAASPDLPDTDVVDQVRGALVEYVMAARMLESDARASEVRVREGESIDERR